MEKHPTSPKNFNARDPDPVSPDAGNRIEYAPVDFWEKSPSPIPKEVRFGKDVSDVWTHAYDATPVIKMEKASLGEQELPMKNPGAERRERQARDNQKMASVYAKIKNFFGGQK